MCMIPTKYRPKRATTRTVLFRGCSDTNIISPKSRNHYRTIERWFGYKHNIAQIAQPLPHYRGMARKHVARFTRTYARVRKSMRYSQNYCRSWNENNSPWWEMLLYTRKKNGNPCVWDIFFPERDNSDSIPCVDPVQYLRLRLAGAFSRLAKIIVRTFAARHYS